MYVRVCVWVTKESSLKQTQALHYIKIFIRFVASITSMKRRLHVRDILLDCGEVFKILRKKYLLIFATQSLN